MAITALLGDVANIIRGNRPGKAIDIDNKMFQLHYRFTTFLFFVFSIVSTANSMIGDPINCACADCERQGITKKMVDTHCWVTGTYTVSDDHRSISTSRRLGLRPEFYGIGTLGHGVEVKYHMYYQWVPFMLFLQGVLFYIPHWMWEINEDGKIQALVSDLRGPTMDKENLRRKVRELTIYVIETLGSYDGYYLRFLVCDSLNIINAIGNLFLTNRFLNYNFFSYGPRCFQYFTQQNDSLLNPMTETFPKLTKCQLQTFGVSGTLQNLDAVCVLALNILNEKIFLVLWLWLLALVLISSSVFVFRTIFMQIKRMRVPIFQRRAHTMRVNDIEDIVENIKIGDYFFISLLAKNLDITAFRMFLSQLAKTMRGRRAFRKLATNALSASKRKRHHPRLLLPSAPSFAKSGNLPLSTDEPC